MTDDAEAAYWRLCDAQTDLNALLDRDNPPPDRVEAARAALKAARDAYRAFIRPQDTENEGEDD